MIHIKEEYVPPTYSCWICGANIVGVLTGRGDGKCKECRHETKK